MIYVHFIEALTGKSFAQECHVIPRAGEFVEYHFDPWDKEKWSEEALESGRYFNGKTWLVLRVEHELRVNELWKRHHLISVAIEEVKN